MFEDEDEEESLLFPLTILPKHAVTGMLRKKYATTRSMRAMKLPNWSMYQNHQKKTTEVSRRIHITRMSTQHNLIDGEIGVQRKGIESRLLISICSSQFSSVVSGVSV